MGAMFANPVYPVIDLASGGTIDGMIHSVDRILAQTDEQTKIVPGHGPVATRADLQDYRDMLVVVRQRIEKLVMAGTTTRADPARVATPEFHRARGAGHPDVGGTLQHRVYR